MARPWFNADPDPSVLRWGWFLWGAWGLAGGALLSADLAGRVPAVGAVLAAPFWSAWLLWLVYRAWARAARWSRHSRWRTWHGNHFEFDGHQVRVLFEQGRIWIAADDVFDALGLHGRQRDPERGRLVAGRDGLAVRRDSGLLVFSEAGLAAWLERRSDPDALKFKRWVERQVIEPQRRREELGSG
jgi:hypothetical protein